MSKILEMKEKRAKTWEQAKAFLDAKQNENGMMSAEDAATYDRMEAEVVNLGKEIDRLERQAAIDAEMAKATSAPITISLVPRWKVLLVRLVEPAMSTRVHSGLEPSEIKCPLMCRTHYPLVQILRVDSLLQMNMREPWWKDWRRRTSLEVLLM